MYSAFIEGLTNVAFNPFILLLIFSGVGVGIVFGSVPGLTATMSIVMFLPMTYTMTPIQGISTLVALYIGGISGGLISAILLNIPGTPSSVATCFDGAPMAKNGMAGKALGTGIVFSFFGTLIGIGILVFMAPKVASFALKFGAYEYCALAIFSLSLVIALTGDDIVKGLISAILGCMFATIGLSPIDSRARFTFGSVNLTAGFKLLVFLIGLFAITEVVKYAEQVRNNNEAEVNEDFKIRGFGFSLKEFFSQWFNTIRSALIGVGIGILPGIGGGPACMISYTVAKNSSKHSDKFGTGIMDGVVASESANNASIGGAMIPLLSLGIPGDAVTAMLLGGLMVHDIAPGPLIFDRNGPVVYGIFVAMVIAAVAMLILEFGGMRVFIRILKIPKQYLFPLIVILCCVGAIGDSNSIFDVWGVLLFGLVGYGLIKAGVPLTPMILGFILGPMFEMNLRKSSQLFAMDAFSLFSRPIALVFLAITAVTVTLNIRATLKREIAVLPE
ncbi:Tat pathway signal protein [Marispirochaeta aestuarii]|uniref:Tat pathway signal protein n=1 Tax=Marispirochaeta aestuarii TaxID=1963862 RepID=A0A1Y1S2E9_9SPIO|nr:tripartite tricarboxylate transporter permease [Marispirochaeta aestuarii]ORC37957.1 Tat pathway signal protein [Marispirochaeta aestuarii]